MIWVYLLIFFVMGVILLFLPIEVRVNYQRVNSQDKIEVQVKILFITFRQVRAAPLVKILSLMARREHNVEEVQEATKNDQVPKTDWLLIIRRLRVWIPKSMQVFSHALKLAARVLKPIKCKRLKLYSEIGFIDASKTGIATGSLWAINSYMLSQLSRWMVIRPDILKVKIVPVYTNSKIHFDYDCIIVFPLGHIIIVVLQTARFMRVSYHLLKGVTQ